MSPKRYYFSRKQDEIEDLGILYYWLKNVVKINNRAFTIMFAGTKFRMTTPTFLLQNDLHIEKFKWR